jgi:hypothetical protein
VTVYIVAPVKNAEKTWAVWVDGNQLENLFPSVEFANAYAHWLAMGRLVEMLREGQAELEGKLKGVLLMTKDDLGNAYLSARDSGWTPDSLKVVVDQFAEFNPELFVALAAHGIEINVAPAISSPSDDRRKAPELNTKPEPEITRLRNKQGTATDFGM